MRIPFTKKIQLWTVCQIANWLNFILKTSEKLFFKPFKSGDEFRNIIIYRVGNIGDIVCAIPCFTALRRNFPKAKITLLTSPGKKGMLGAKELLDGAPYFDEQIIYYREGIDSIFKKIKLVWALRKNNYDLFIEIPNELGRLNIFLRDIIFAKILGVKSAFGFKIRTVRLAAKLQSDYKPSKNEVEGLLDVLKENNIGVEKVKFNFPISKEDKKAVRELLKNKWGDDFTAKKIVAIHPGAKEEVRQWPIERFIEIVKIIQKKYKVKIVITGGKEDIEKGEIIKRALNNKDVLIAAGQLSILQTAELLKKCKLLISNDTGVVHLASAAGLPIVVLVFPREIKGKWDPYGNKNIVIRGRCPKSESYSVDFKGAEECMKSIGIDEVANAVEEIIGKDRGVFGVKAQKRKLSIAYFGGYDPLYARVRITLKGLRQNDVQVFECQSRYPIKLIRLVILAFKYIKIAGKVDILMVCEAGQAYVPLAKILALLTSKPLALDAFLSYYHVKIIEAQKNKNRLFQFISAFYYYYLDKISCWLADFVLLDTEGHIDYFCGTFNISKSKFRVFPIGSDDEWFFPTPQNKKSDFITVLCVSTFYPLHGVKYIIEAAKLLESIPGFPALQFVFVGNGHMRTGAEDLASKLSLKKIIFKDSVLPYQLPKIIDRADICLGQFGDTQQAKMVIPFKIWDAMAMEKPVITQKTELIQSAFRDRENIVLCNSADPESLAKAIKFLAENPAKRKKIAENGRRVFETRATLKVLGAWLKSILFEVLDN